MSINPSIQAVKWNNIYKIICDLFISRNNEGVSDLAEDINYIITTLSRELDDTPFLGRYDKNLNTLDQYEQVPQEPLEKTVVLSALASIFRGVPKWHDPRVMHNINPPPMISTVAAAAVCNLYNPNAIWDFVSGGAFAMEQQIVRQMARTARWPTTCDGVFTFGGKGCLTYAIRIGLNRCLSSISSLGLSGARPVVITSEANHYSIDTVCSLVGIGTSNCLRARTHADETMDMASFEELLDSALTKGHSIAALILSGGNTLHLSIDDLSVARAIVDDMVEKHQLSYRPYLYFDTVVGWPWMFYLDYSFEDNPLQLPDEILPLLSEATEKIRPITAADGFGIDFHKLGMCPFLTSLFLTKDGRELHSIHKDELVEIERKSHGGNFLQHHTIEHSRSAAPIASAWVSLQMAGVNGYRSYLANGVAIACAIRDTLPGFGFELLNSYSLGFASVFAPVPEDTHYSYADLLNSTHERINEHNIYTFNMFQYLQDIARNGIDSFLFRFLPQYRKSMAGQNVAVIVVYPMAMDMDTKLASEIARNVGQIKKVFDARRYLEEDLSDLIPIHVPK